MLLIRKSLVLRSASAIVEETKGEARVQSKPAVTYCFPSKSEPTNFTFLSAVPMRVRAILEMEAPAGPQEAPAHRHGWRPRTDARESDR